MRHEGGGGKGCRDMIWQGCQEQSPDASSGKQPSQVAWHAGTRWQAELWLAEEGGQGNQNSKGQLKEGTKGGRPRREEGEVSVNHIN